MTKNQDIHKTIVVVGAGFAGLAAIVKLLKLGIKEDDILLIDARDNFEYAPGYHEAIERNCQIADYSFSLKKFYEKIFLKGFVTKVANNNVILNSGQKISYDYVVLANGSRTNYFGNESYKKFGFGFKSLEDVITLKQHIGKGKTISVIGGGYTGVEVATVLAENKENNVQLIHSRDRLMHQLDESVSKRIEKWCTSHGIVLSLNNRVKELTKDSIVLENGEKLSSDISILSIGVKANCDIVDCEDYTLNNDLSFTHDKNIFICGDTATETGALPTAHNAMLEGRFVAQQLYNRLQGKNTLSVERYNKNWKILAIALGTKDGIVTHDKKGVFVPKLVGLMKRLIMWRCMFEFKYRVLLLL